MHQSIVDLIPGKRRKSKPSAPRLERGNNLGHVIADHAKSRVLGILFDDPPQSILRIGGHGIGLVQNNQFHPALKKLAGARKILDLVPHHVDSSGVTGVEFEGHAGVGFCSVHSFGCCDDGACFPGSRWSVEEEMGEVVAVD